jgi:hypothetical protein
MSSDGKPTRPRRWGLLAPVLVLGLLFVITVFAGFVAYEASREVQATTISERQAVPASAGRLIVDLPGVQSEIVPGPPGSPIEIDGEFDASGFRWMPEYRAQGTGWTYVARLRPVRILEQAGVRGTLAASVRIRVPRDVPLSIEGRVGRDADVELGGLSVRDADMKFGTGDHRVAFSERLPMPLERLALKASVGELELVKLGNASPREIYINKNVGDLCVDLRGPWARDTAFVLECGLGSCDLHRPGSGEAAVRVWQRGALLGDEPAASDDGLPVIEVKVESALRSAVELTAALTEP